MDDFRKQAEQITDQFSVLIASQSGNPETVVKIFGAMMGILDHGGTIPRDNGQVDKFQVSPERLAEMFKTYANSDPRMLRFIEEVTVTHRTRKLQA